VISAQGMGAPILGFGQLTTNGRVNPLGIPASDISFGWSVTCDTRGTEQEAYQVIVGTGVGLQDVWDSGQVVSSHQVGVLLPSSVQLQSATRYYWQVRIWDKGGNASSWSNANWFETGLLTETDWQGADWITRSNNSSINPASWTNYTVTVNFTLIHEAFGVFIRSSVDGRNSYMMQVNVTGSSPVFKPHKCTNGTYSVLTTINLSSYGYTNASLTGTLNTLRFDVSGSTITTRLNGTIIDTRTNVAYPSGLVGFRTWGAEEGSADQIQVVNSTNGATLLNTDFSSYDHGFSGGVVSNGALVLSGTIDAIYVNYPASLPLLRGQFETSAQVASVRIYASAQGLYEVSINGQKAGDQFLAPGWTDYTTRIQSQTYDITNLVQTGTNVIGVELADGWYCGKVGMGWTDQYGTQLAFVAKIKVTYTDGSTVWYATNSSWKAGNSPYIAADLQDGQTYNANLEQPGWNTINFDASGWSGVATVTNVSSRLVPQPDEPCRQVTVLTAQSRTEILPGRFIYDLGQNMVGVVRVSLSGTADQTITIRHGEEIYRTGSQTGQLYTENLRTAKATDSYIFAADGTITYQPKFTQHGFRYVEITGTSNPPAAANVQGIVISSDLEETGNLQTSNAMLNQLMSNIRWGQRSNFLSIPTDTPARDERLGWTGDINVFSPAAARNADTRAFLTKWMADMRDTQKANGNIPAVVPQPGTAFDETGVGWSDAFITVPYSVWQATGDEKIIRENWEAMKDFYGFVHNSATSDGDLLEQGRSSWFSGDWLSLEGGWNRLEEHKVIATAYFAEDTRMMSEMAVVMGQSSLSAQWAALVPQIRSAFVNAYRNSNGTIYQGTQCVYAMALGMNIITDPAQRNQTAARFIEKLAADNYHLRTGFLGTPWLLPSLSSMGRNDLAFRLLLNQDYPSWGFPITMGATTMWERWNSINPNGTFGPVDMNSFNHYAYGAVGNWMYANIGGIQALEPGYKKSLIAPLIGFGGLTSAVCSQETVYGRLAANWSISEQNIILQVEVPVNTTAVVYVPAGAGAAIYEGGVPAQTADGVQLLKRESSRAEFLVGSGTYTFTVTPTTGPILVAQYAFEGNMNDSSVNANHAIAANGLPGFVTGQDGLAVDLNGTDQYTVLPANMLFGVTDFTAACWANWDGGGAWQRVFDFGNNTSQYLFLTPYSGGVMRFAIKNGGSEQTLDTTTLPAGQWVHLAVTLEGDTGTLYVDGEAVATNPSMTINPSSFNPANNYIGQSQWPDPLFSGRIDDFRIYNYALSDSQVAVLAGGEPAPSFASDPISNTDATELEPYTGYSLAGYINVPAGGLTFSKDSGRDWLVVAGDGTLSGIPNAADVGENTFTVRVEDILGQYDIAQMTIQVENLYTGALGIDDLLGMATQWLKTGCTDIPACNGADLDGDNDVTISDFAIMAHHWLDDSTL
jgi:alpha-L-rhamnosidase